MDKHPYFPPGVFIDTEMAYEYAPSCTTTLQKIDKETLLADFQKAIDAVVAAEAISARLTLDGILDFYEASQLDDSNLELQMIDMLNSQKDTMSQD